MKNKIVIVVLIFFLLLSGSLRSQDTTTHYDTLYSDILKEKRAIQISFPDSYKRGSTDKYDVLYVLDGEWNTSLAKTAREFLGYAKFIPANVMIVGIPNLYQGNNNMRDRDFTPTHMDFNPLSGGASNFLSFLKNELLPYIEKQYPAKNQSSTLYGTSLGGLFTLYAFLQESSLFKSYLAIEPSLWWDNGYINKLVSQKVEVIANSQNTLWIASRDEAAYREMGISDFDSLLNRQTFKDLDWKVQTYPNETHFSVIWKGFYDGLKFSYKGLMPEGDFLLRPLNGRVAKEKPFQVRCYNTSPENYIRYITDRSEPTITSAKLKSLNIFSFSESTVLTIKSVNARKENDKIIRCEFKVEDFLVPIQKLKNVKSEELAYKYYKGNWDELPDFNKLKPTQKGIATNDFDLNKLDRQNGFACLLEGFLKIPEEGYYYFGMDDDNSSKVWLGEQMVIGDHNIPGRGQSFVIYLQKGLYPYKAAYLHKKGAHSLFPVTWHMENQENFSPIPINFFMRNTK